MNKGSEYHRQHQKVVQNSDIKCEILQCDQCAAKFPYIHFKECDEAWYESSGAGYVNPREFVRAEQTLATQRGCAIIDDVVTDVTRDVYTQLMKLRLRRSGNIHARKVLLATGAFTEFFNLLPIKLDVALTSSTVVLAEVSKTDQESMGYEMHSLATSP